MEATADNELIWKENNAENRYVSVAQSAVNQEVCGSSPPRDDESVCSTSRCFSRNKSSREPLLYYTQNELTSRWGTHRLYGYSHRMASRSET